jgi:hypothetical protein
MCQLHVHGTSMFHDRWFDVVAPRPRELNWVETHFSDAVCERSRCVWARVQYLGGELGLFKPYAFWDQHTKA